MMRSASGEPRFEPDLRELAGLGYPLVSDAFWSYILGVKLFSKTKGFSCQMRGAGARPLRYLSISRGAFASSSSVTQSL